MVALSSLKRTRIWDPSNALRSLPAQVIFSSDTLALMGLQWWIYSRQLRSIEGDLGRVATTVGREILSGDLNVFFDEIDADAEAHTGFAWVAAEGMPATGEETKGRVEAPVVLVPGGAKLEVKHFVKQRIVANGEDPEFGTVVEESCEVKVGPEAGEETGNGHERRGGTHVPAACRTLADRGQTDGRIRLGGRLLPGVRHRSVTRLPAGAGER